MFSKVKKVMRTGVMTATVLSVVLLAGAADTSATEVVDVSGGVTEQTESEAVSVNNTNLLTTSGIEYIYAKGDTTNPIGMNLNGNSVIIQAADKDTGSGTRWINLIIDKDRDGVIDADESMAVIDGETDFIGGPTIYGYYGASEASQPISITIRSGYVTQIFGAYQSQLTTSDETAITMRMLGGEVAGNFCGASKSKVVSTGAPAVEVEVESQSEISTSCVAAGMESEILVKNATTPGMRVQMKKGNVSTLYALQGSSYKAEGCTGPAVQISVTGGSVTRLYGIHSGKAVSDGNNDTMLDMDISMKIVSAYAAYEADIDAGKNTNTALDLDFTGEGIITGEMKGIYGRYNADAAYSVRGNVDVNLAPQAGTASNMANTYVVSDGVVLDGNLTINLKNVRGNGLYGVNNGSRVKGNVTVDVPKGNELTGTTYGMCGSMCEGNLTVRYYGSEENSSSYNYVYGYQGACTGVETVVGKDFYFEYLGGDCGYLYGGYSYGSSQTSRIGGKAEIMIRKGTFGGVYLLQNTVVTKDITATVGDYTTDMTVSGNPLDTCRIKNSFTGLYSCQAENVVLKVRTTGNTQDNSKRFYALEACNLSKDAEIEIDGGIYSYIAGLYSCNVQGNADIHFKDVNKDWETYRNGSTSYGISGGGVGGNITVLVEDSFFCSFYAADNHTCGESLTSTIKNTETYNALYGPSPTDCTGDITSTLTNVKGVYVYGAYQRGDWGGKVTIDITNAGVQTGNTSYSYLYGFYGGYNNSIEKDVTLTLKDCSFLNSYGVYNGRIKGNLKVDIVGGTYGSDTTSGYNYCAYPSSVQGTSTVNITDATYYGDVYPYQITYGETGCGDAIITVKNTEFKKGPNQSFVMRNSGGVGQKVTMTLDENSSVADEVEIYAGSGQAECIIYYNGEVYYGGAIKFTENQNFDKVHLSEGSFYIPKGITVTIADFDWTGGSILLEGALNATLSDSDAESGTYISTSLYMAGGTTTVDTQDVKEVYWPFELNYKEKGGTVTEAVTYTYKPVKHPQGGDRLFGKAGSDIKYDISAAEGYSIASVTYTTEGVKNNVAGSGTTYTMTMPNAACSFDVDFQGNQIVVGKTMADPVLKHNVATTEESPAYDFSTLSISNDGLTGAVSYKVDSTYSLPEGLSLRGDKIIGTPTAVYESGKKTIIHVTGKNDTEAEVPIYFVVTQGGGTQTNQEGRITVDDTGKMIYLNGNSVVIETEGNQTAIYLDDNRDGVADFETPACQGDYTSYTLYGVRNADARKSLRITMNGGTIGTLYGVYNGKITAGGTSLGVYLSGGSLGTLKALDTATVTGDIEVIVSDNASVTTSSVPTSTSLFNGCYYDNKGNVSVYGKYNFTRNIEVTSLSLYGTHNIPAGVSVKTTTLSRMTGSVLYLKGGLDATTAYSAYNYYGTIVVQGGTLTNGEDNTWDYVYYPLVFSSNINKTSARVTNSGDYLDVTEDGVKTRYVRAGNVLMSMTAPDGYEYYYRYNNGETVQLTDADTDSFTLKTEHKAGTFECVYVPKQIVLEKLFADPTGKAGETYTKEKPLYDLRGLILENDTTAAYGGNVKYALKNPDALPSGLSFEDGRVIGTPTTVDLTGKTLSFVVTGRNGTTETVDVVIKIADEDYETADINDTVTVSNSKIDLEGTSVVVLADPLDSSKSQIFMDADHDGVADNNTPLLINKATSYSLASYSILGYQDTSKAYEGDIYITVKGAKLKNIYGAYGQNTRNRVTVNGKVVVDVRDAVTSTAEITGLKYAKAQNLAVSVTGGAYEKTNFNGAEYSEVTGNMDFAMTGNLKITLSSKRSEIDITPAYDSEIGGNVNMKLGATDTNYGFVDAYATSYSYFYGVRSSTVTGDVHCDVDGYWYSGYFYLTYGSTVGKDVVVEVADGAELSSRSSEPYMAKMSTITGAVRFDVEENAKYSVRKLYVLEGSSARNITVNVPESASENIGSLLAMTDTVSSVQEGIYINQRGAISLGGNYTVNEDLEAKGLTVLEDADVTIAEGAVVTMPETGFLIIEEDAVLTNKGTLDMQISTTSTSGVEGTLVNQGNLKMTSDSYRYYQTIQTNGVIINQTDGVWEVGTRINNLGKIVNYGEWTQTYNQSYYYDLGVMYSSVPVTFALNPAMNRNYTNNSSLYFAVTIEYPSHCVDSVTLSGDAVTASGIKGDTRQYVKGLYYTASNPPKFVVTPGNLQLDNINIASVTYGPWDNDATEQSDGTWTGTGINIFEPFTIRINYAASEETTKITLDKTEDSIVNTQQEQPLVFNKYYSYNSPLYDLRDIKISNDMEESGQITYYVDASSSLPNGLQLYNGRLYGTLKAATETEQEVVFVIKGKNQTSAFFTLTLGPVAKQVPTWSVPTGLSALAGEILDDVTLPDSGLGTYSWPDETVSVGNTVTVLQNQTLLFTPRDTVNYDWAAAVEKAGVTYENGVITCEVDVQVCAGIPAYTAPETITATYGDTYGEIEIPAGDNDGRFEWEYTLTSTPGMVGTLYRWVTYIPNDSNYQRIPHIKVTLVVEKAVPTYRKISAVSQDCGSTLADILLPDVEGGKYQWITTTTTIPLDGKTYQAGFKPDDVRNYDWSQVEGWDDAWKCVVFPITVNLKHTYATVLSYDETHHWYPCLDETCDSVEGKETHLWDEGFVLEKATVEKEGVIEYSCKCGASYTAAIPKLTHAEHVYTSGWKFDADTHWKQCIYKDCVVTTEPQDHDFNDGVAVSAPAGSKKGVVKYTCKVCKYVSTEYLDAEEWENSGWGESDDDVMHPGDDFTDARTKAKYEVSKKSGEVIFVGPNKKTYSKYTVPNTVEVNGVRYKVTEIAPNAFKGNKNLKTVKIGSGIKTIGARAFYGCTKLTKVTIGSNVETIGNSAFQNCTALKNLTLPKKVSKIGSKAFYGCKKLTKLTVNTTKLSAKKVGKQAFTKMGSSNYKKVTVKVPKKKLKIYKKMFVKAGLSKKARIKK